MLVRRRSVLVTAGATALVVCLGACSEGGTSSGTGAAQAAEVKTARIYAISPQTGTDAGSGLGAAHAVELAVRQSNERGDIPGWKLEVTLLDDKGDKGEAAAVAKKAAADPEAVAVVGSIFSGLTKAAQGPLAQAGMPQVSPSATNPTLTKGDAYATKPERTYPNFFRVIAPDDAHAPALSRYLREKGVARVVVVHDGDSYGSGLAEAFTGAFTKDGGQVLSTDTVDPNKPSRYPELVKKIIGLRPQAVMFGGNDPQGGPLSEQLKRAGLHVPVVGGDAFATEMFIVRAGAQAAGDVSTAAGKPVDQVEQGRTFLAQYRAAGFPDGATGYGPLAYDATNAVIAALKTSLPRAASAQASRPDTIAALAKVSFDGTSGKVAFDEYGDITPRVVTVNSLVGGQWAPAKTYDLG